jgi:hypothetical protein
MPDRARIRTWAFEPPASGPATGALGSHWRRLEGDADRVERGLAQLVLSLVELLRQVMERQAVRRYEAGALSDEQVEQLGTALFRLAERMEELKAAFDLTDEDLDLSLNGSDNCVAGHSMAQDGD